MESNLLYECMQQVNNFFVKDIIDGTFAIENGTLELPKILTGQYFIVKGSTLNDGFYQYPTFEMTDEIFEGQVYLCSIPKDFLNLVEEIEQYKDEHKSEMNSVYQSESFGGYSYSKPLNAEGVPIGWKDVFKNKLLRYKKI